MESNQRFMKGDQESGKRKQVMFLYKKRIRSSSIKHPFSRFERLPPEELENAVIKLRCGDSSQIEVIVKSHVKLLIYIAGQYMTAGCNDSHELISEGMLAMTMACLNHEELHDCNITGYLVFKIHTALREFIRKDSVVVVPYQDRGRAPKQLPESEYYHPFNLTELNELIERSMETEFERDIISLRREGFDDVEIGQKLGRSKQWIHEQRRNVYRRFLKNDDE